MFCQIKLTHQRVNSDDAEEINGSVYKYSNIFFYGNLIFFG